MTLKNYLANYGWKATKLAKSIEVLRQAAVECDKKMGFPIARMVFK